MGKTKPRQCQPCTACCDGWVQMVIDGVEVYPGKPCPHSTGAGCRVYARRPTIPCREFECGWIKTGSPLPDWLKPDLARVMVLPDLRRWRGYPVDLAVPVGKRIPPRALNWLKQYAESTARPLIYLEHPAASKGYVRDPLVVCHGPVDFQIEIRDMLARGESPWQTVLHAHTER